MEESNITYISNISEYLIWVNKTFEVECNNELSPYH